jgi:hypothetical protein
MDLQLIGKGTKSDTDSNFGLYQIDLNNDQELIRIRGPTLAVYKNMIHSNYNK